MPMSATDKQMADRIENDFSYHPPKEGQIESFRHIRSQAKTLALDIVALCPEGRERALALTHLEEVVMWSNASIARAG